jgi:hypothetical protein
MKNFKLLARDLPVHYLLDIVDAHPDWWSELTLRQSYPGSAHKETQSIILSGTSETTDLQKIFDDLTQVQYPHMAECADALSAILRPCLEALPKVTSFGRIIIAKLPSGKAVDPHIDEGRYAEAYMRLHVPMRTNAAAWLKSGDETCAFKDGELWWFNHRISHAAFNLGDTDRIHLIVDVQGEL